MFCLDVTWTPTPTAKNALEISKALIETNDGVVWKRLVLFYHPHEGLTILLHLMNPACFCNCSLMTWMATGRMWLERLQPQTMVSELLGSPPKPVSMQSNVRSVLGFGAASHADYCFRGAFG